MNTFNEDLIRVAEAYRDGSYRGDGELLQSIFTDNCLSCGYIEQEPVTMPMQEYIAWLTSVPSMESQNIAFKTAIESAEAWGDIGVLTVREWNFFGTKNYLDTFQLMKMDGVWKIVSKLFTTF